MADLPPNPDTDGGNDPTTDTPRWAYAFAIVIAILVVAFVILHLTGHGLGNHSL